jgi:serine/threonine protein kinase
MDLALDEIPIVEDILRRMLEISPTRRATAEELIQHKWLQAV